MACIHVNNVSSFGTTNPITLSSATTNQCSWVSAPNFPLIGGADFARISVQPDTAGEEIIHLHGYTPGGTTGYVSRAQEGTTASAVSGVAWVHPTTAQEVKSPAARVVGRMMLR